MHAPAKLTEIIGKIIDAPDSIGVFGLLFIWKNGHESLGPLARQLFDLFLDIGF